MGKRNGAEGSANPKTDDGSAEIILDGVPVLVGQNLEKALRTLREIPEISNGMRVWVDALCINQQEVQEKNFEVKRMGEIYKKTDRVVSYLGEESDQSGHILEFMDAIGEVMQQAKVLAPIIPSAGVAGTRFRGWPVPTPERSATPANGILGFLRNIQADMAFSMTRFLLRTYFSGIWIIQEIVLGGKKSIAICGARRFSWTSLLRGGKLLNAGMAVTLWNFDMKLDPTQNQNEDDKDYLTLADLKDCITKLQMLRDAHIDSRRAEEDEADRHVPGSSTLWFRIPSSNNATDWRDLIYGMMNLLPKKLTDLIYVEHASTNRFADMMRTFAEAHILSTQSLHWILIGTIRHFWATKTGRRECKFGSAI